MLKMSRQVDVKALISHIVRGDGSDRCRICMGDTTDGQVHLEDTVLMDGDKPVTLAELLEAVTGVEVESTATLPNNVCSKCIQELTTVFPFIKLCRDSSNYWARIANYLANIAVAKKTKNIYICVDKNIKTYTDTTRCTSNKVKNRKDALRNFKIRLYRKMSYQIRTQNEKKRVDVKMICPECHEEYNNIYKYNKHLWNLGKKMCGRCNKIVCVQSFAEHLKTHHMSVYVCGICYETFEKSTAYLLHKKRHDRGKEICPECKLSFMSSNHLNMHLNKHKPTVCGCSKKFTNRICFLKHTKQCSQHEDTNSKYICDYCKIEYQHKSALKMHIKLRHTIGRLFQCDKCGNRFSSRAHLIEHGNTHERIADRHVCACGAKYSTRRGFKRHLKMHDIENKQ